MEQVNENCNCEKCQLRHLFFSNINPGKLSGFCETREEIKFRNGEMIVEEGEPINKFLYLKEGLVKLSKKTITGREQIISFSKPFDFVNLLSVFSSEKYKYSVSALEDTVVCSFELDFIKAQAEKNAMFAIDLMSKISEATDIIILDSLEIKRKNLKGRVAHVLMYFSRQVYGNDEFQLPVSRREIADYIGMTAENVIRTLSEFRRDKIIKIYGKDILIIEPGRLANISRLG